MFRRSSQGGGTSLTSDNYGVWLSSSECDPGDKVCYLRLPCCHFQESFRSVKSWIDDLRKLAEPAIVVVVGNKSDLAESRQVVQAGCF